MHHFLEVGVELRRATVLKEAVRSSLRSGDASKSVRKSEPRSTEVKKKKILRWIKRFPDAMDASVNLWVGVRS